MVWRLSSPVLAGRVPAIRPQPPVRRSTGTRPAMTVTESPIRPNL